MELTGDLFIKLGKATCDFANLRQITCAADVEQLFPWLQPGFSLEGRDPDPAATYKAEQKELIGLLDRLIDLNGDVWQAGEFRQHSFKRVAVENVKRPARHQIDKAEIRFGERGFELDIQPQNTRGVKIAWLLFIDAALAPEPHGRYLRSKRLSRCVWELCPERFWLADLPTRRGGFPRRSHKGHSEEQEKIRRKRRKG